MGTLALMDTLIQKTIPLAMQATGVIDDYLLVLDLLVSSCSSYEVLRQKFDVLIERCRFRFSAMVKAGLFDVFAAVLQGCLQLNNRDKSILTLRVMQTVCQDQTNWSWFVEESNAVEALTLTLLRCCEKPEDVDVAASLLNAILGNKDSSIILKAHRAKATQACLHRLGHRVPCLQLLNEMCSCNSACRYILRKEHRSLHTFNQLCYCLDAAGEAVYQKRYLTAVSAFCRLVDNDLVRSSALLDMQRISRLVLHQLQGDLHVHAIRLFRSLIGRGISCFMGQEKESKRPSALQISSVASQWATLLGGSSVQKLLTTVQKKPSDGVWRMSLVVLEEVARHISLDTETGMTVIAALSFKLQRTKDITTIRKLLHTSMQISLSAGINLASNLALINACNSVTRRPDFDLVCRGERFYHTAATTWSRTQDCSVCLEKLHYDVQQTGCKHAFHAACLRQWLHVSEIEQCPLCRSIGIDVVEILLKGTRPPPVPRISTPVRRMRSRNR
jgi:Ring finger domain